MAHGSSFTGRRRERKTSFGIKATDIAARILITFGGIGTIIAVLMVALFLIWVVWPLVRPAETLDHASAQSPFPQEKPLHIAVDDHQTMGYALLKDGRLIVFQLDNGEKIEERQAIEGHITASSFDSLSNHLIVGFDTGEIQAGRIRFESVFVNRDDIPPELANLKPGDTHVLSDYRLFQLEDNHQRLLSATDADQTNLSNGRAINGTAQIMPTGQLRIQRVAIQLDDKITTGGDWPIRLVYRIQKPNEDEIYTIFNDNSELRLLEPKENMFTGETTLQRYEVPYTPRENAGRPQFVLMSTLGDIMFLGWPDGTVRRYYTRNPSQVSLAETLDVVDDPDAKLTVMSYLLGGATVIVGDSAGNLSAWFGFKPPAAGHTAEGYPLVIAEDIPDIVSHKLRPARPEELPEHLAATGESFHVNEFPEQLIFTQVHTMPQGNSAVQSVGMSTRSRLLVAGYESGEIQLYQTKTESSLLTIDPPKPAAVNAVALAPKVDGILANLEDRIGWWRIDKHHPEATPTSLFAPVWYESYNQPSFTWQSSSASDDFEMKLSLVPLIFGTLKATFYAMIFAVPLALLAAVYTSEFIHPKAKMRIKPIVEMMASLPSVVLGFLAGLVFAPYIEDAIPAVLASFFCVPLCFLIGAYLWQLLPHGPQIYLSNLGVAQIRGISESSGPIRWLHKLVLLCGGIKLLLVLVMLAVGVLLAMVVGPLLSDWLFAGSLKSWLNYSPFDENPETDKYHYGLGGWLILLWPLGAMATAWIFTRYVNPRLRDFAGRLQRGHMALLNLGKFLVGVVLTVIIALVAGQLLLLVGLDPRGPIDLFGFNLAPMGSAYIQRNALIVGFVMGFAVIPIIYTIAEDALSAVPEHLRSASLACGATPWQTATRVIIPTATSGLFSACMIGLGRAVGETMIVLMALGSTAVLDLSMFNGARPLSANIAIEMPEAVKDGTLYRTLFLCGLTLFVMTFIVNTVAEAVRLRFRKRNLNL